MTEPSDTRVELPTELFVSGRLTDPWEGSGERYALRALPGWSIWVFLVAGWAPWLLIRRHLALKGVIWVPAGTSGRTRALELAPSVFGCLAGGLILYGLCLDSGAMLELGLVSYLATFVALAVRLSRGLRARVDARGEFVTVGRVDPVAATAWRAALSSTKSRRPESNR